MKLKWMSKKPNIVSIILILIMTLSMINVVIGQDYSERNDKPIYTSLGASNNSNTNQDSEQVSSLSSPLNSNLIETNSHGGSWLDSFEDDSGLESMQRLNRYDGNMILDKSNSTLPNYDFELGNIGQLPDHWKDYIFELAPGAGTYSKNCSLVNTHYYSGQKGLFAQLRTNDRNMMMNISLKQGYTNLSGSKFVYVHMRDIVVTKGSSIWGWESMIILRYDDGSNVVTQAIYRNSEIGGFYNRYNYTLKGNDGQNWYVYKREIPKSIDTSHLNFSIVIWSKDWYSSSANTDISTYIDRIQFNDGYFYNGTLISKSIDLPSAMQWDTLMINKTEPKDTYINITILNASDNQPIPGSLTYNVNGEVDISTIDPVKYPKIKLQVRFEGNGFSTPELYYWGVSWNTSNSWRETFYSGLKSNSYNLTFDDGEMWLNTSATEFIKYAGNPVLNLGNASEWDDFRVMRPCIIYNGTGYMMYYLGLADSNTWAIGLATSSDGISWKKYSGNPIITVGPPSSWDENYVGHPYVIYDGFEYKMWFGGRGSVTSWQIGYANSSNGYSWQKYSGNPVIPTGASGSFDDWYVTLPCVYYDGLTYHNWYTGLQNINPSVAPYTIGYASSYDCTNWTRYQNNPLIIGPQGYFNGVTTFTTVIRKGQYSGWYTYQQSPSNLRIDHASSSDGLNWVKYSNNPVLEKGSSGAWDDEFVFYSNVIYRDKQYWMYYSGYDGSTARIGLARSMFDSNGKITSKLITIPNKCYYDTLLINKTISMGNSLNVTILDGSTNKSIKGYENLGGSIIDISNISPLDHPSLRLQMNFKSSYRTSTPVLYDWSINWTRNQLPKVVDCSDLTIVNRTHSIKICANLSDHEEPEQELTLEIEYKSPMDSSWQSDFLTSPVFLNDHWECTFTPPADADVGVYSFRFTCNDCFQDKDIQIDPNFIIVDNNDPIIHEIDSLGSVNRTKTLTFSIDSGDIETTEENLVLTARYRPLGNLDWENGFISNIRFQNNDWLLDFTPTKDAGLGWYSLEVTCNDTLNEHIDITLVKVLNNHPIIEEISFSAPDVKRTKTVKIYIETSDVEKSEIGLDVDIKYRSPEDVLWQTEFISNLFYDNNRWEADFAPTANSEIGNYQFKITCNDSIDEVFQETLYSVLNNPPGEPGVSILPNIPKTMDDLTLDLIESIDIDTNENEIEYWYRWYKNGIHLPNFDNETSIPSIITTKDETWRCLVYPFDGIDLGPPGDAATIVINSPPELVMDFDSYTIYEDEPEILPNKLAEIFSDADLDTLLFSSSGADQKNIGVKIHQSNGTLELIPVTNWYGTEIITFYASDSLSAPAQETVTIKVLPTNDLPRIVKIGNQLTLPSYPELVFTIDQDDMVDLPVLVEDIDGDVARGLISYSTNLSGYDNLYFKAQDHTFYFNPGNDDVGAIFIKIVITDNNETPARFVTQNIKVIIKNINDPPTVQILTPFNDTEFIETENISFTCVGDDIDLLVPNSKEELTYTWKTDKSDLSVLGYGQELKNITLPVGNYQITVEVKDSGGLISEDTINLKVKNKDKAKDKAKESTTAIDIWVVLILIIIVIVMILIFAFMFYRKKKVKAQASPQGPPPPPEVPIGSHTTPYIPPEPQQPQQPLPYHPPPAEPPTQPPPQTMPPSPTPPETVTTTTSSKPSDQDESTPNS